MNFAPVAVFAYDRPDHLRRVIDALRLNPEAERSRLVLHSDAPKNPAAAERVQEVRSYCRTVRGFGSVDIVAQDRNQGVARSIVDGVTAMTAKYGRVIVLEDDLVPASHFLGYMNRGLDLYERVERVASIAGYFFPIASRLPETFFVRGADCWGWATWKRAWDEFEHSGKRLREALRERNLTYEFDFEGSYPYTKMLEEQIKGKNDSWAIRWYASAFLRDRLTLYPRSSQIQNIGADGSGVHVLATEVFRHSSWGEPIRVEEIPIRESAEGRAEFARGLRGSLAKPAVGVLNRLARRLGVGKRNRT